MAREMPLFNEHPVSFGESQIAGAYRGVCVYIVDGDTFDVLLDLGFMQYSLVTVRLFGANTPELRSRDEDERVKAKAAKNRVSELLLDRPVLIKTYKDKRSFSRFVAETWLQCSATRANFPNHYHSPPPMREHADSWLSLAALLIYEGHAAATG